MRVLIWIVGLLTAAVLLVTAYLLKVRYDDYMRELSQCRSSAQELRSKLGIQSSFSAQMKEEQLRQKAAVAELSDLRQRWAQTEQRVQAFKELRGKLQKMIDTGKLDVLVRKGRMILKLSAAVLFPSGEADLSEDGKQALQEIATVLKTFPNRQFMISGHTDNQPVVRAGFKNNWELSTARAVHVTEFLVEQGIKPSNLVASGYSEYDPIVRNSAKGAAHNRRIEIELLPNLAELPKLLDETSPAESLKPAP